MLLRECAPCSTSGPDEGLSAWLTMNALSLSQGDPPRLAAPRRVISWPFLVVIFCALDAPPDLILRPMSVSRVTRRIREHEDVRYTVIDTAKILQILGHITSGPNHLCCDVCQRLL